MPDDGSGLCEVRRNFDHIAVVRVRVRVSMSMSMSVNVSVVVRMSVRLTGEMITST